jgi:hypothetical protein
VLSSLRSGDGALPPLARLGLVASAGIFPNSRLFELILDEPDYCPGDQNIAFRTFFRQLALLLMNRAKFCQIALPCFCSWRFLLSKK